MAIFNNRNKEKRELGFGSKHYEKPVRFINNDGSVNVRRTGLNGLNNLDIYHWLIRASRINWIYCYQLVFCHHLLFNWRRAVWRFRYEYRVSKIYEFVFL